MPQQNDIDPELTAIASQAAKHPHTSNINGRNNNLLILLLSIAGVLFILVWLKYSVGSWNGPN